MKFNLHLFQRCHKNAYKEQAHDSDLQWLHSPEAAVAFKGLYSPAGDISQYGPEEKERAALAWSGCLHAGQPIQKHIHCLSFTREFLHLLKVLLLTIRSSGPSEVFSVFGDDAQLHRVRVTSQRSRNGSFASRRRVLGKQAGTPQEMAGTHVEGAMTQAHRFPCSHRHTGNTHKGSQIHTCMNCRGEAVRYASSKVRFF